MTETPDSLTSATVLLESGIVPAQFRKKLDIEKIVKRHGGDANAALAEMESLAAENAAVAEDWSEVKSKKERRAALNQAATNEASKGESKPKNRRGGTAQHVPSNNTRRTEKKRGVRQEGLNVVPTKGPAVNPIKTAISKPTPAANPVVSTSTASASAAPAVSEVKKSVSVNAWALGSPLSVKLLDQQKKPLKSETEAAKTVSKDFGSEVVEGKGNESSKNSDLTAANVLSKKKSSRKTTTISSSDRKNSAQKQEASFGMEIPVTEETEPSTHIWAAKASRAEKTAAVFSSSQGASKTTVEDGTNKNEKTSTNEGKPRNAPSNIAASKSVSYTQQNEKQSVRKSNRSKGSVSLPKAVEKQQIRILKPVERDGSSNASKKNSNAARTVAALQNGKLPDEFKFVPRTDAFEFGDFDGINSHSSELPSAAQTSSEWKKQPKVITGTSENGMKASIAQIEQSQDRFASSSCSNQSAKKELPQENRISSALRITPSVSDGKTINATDYESQAIAQADAAAKHEARQTTAHSAASISPGPPSMVQHSLPKASHMSQPASHSGPPHSGRASSNPHTRQSMPAAMGFSNNAPNMNDIQQHIAYSAEYLPQQHHGFYGGDFSGLPRYDPSYYPTSAIQGDPTGVYQQTTYAPLPPPPGMSGSSNTAISSVHEPNKSNSSGQSYLQSGSLLPQQHTRPTAVPQVGAMKPPPGHEQPVSNVPANFQYRSHYGQYPPMGHAFMSPTPYFPQNYYPYSFAPNGQQGSFPPAFVQSGYETNGYQTRHVPQSRHGNLNVAGMSGNNDQPNANSDSSAPQQPPYYHSSGGYNSQQHMFS